MLYRKSSSKFLIEKDIQSVVNVDSVGSEDHRLKQLTYHSSRPAGDAVFLLGDYRHLTSSPYKNQVYRMAGLGRTASRTLTMRHRRTKSCDWLMSVSPGP